MKRCPHCGAGIADDNARFCPACGNECPTAPQPAPAAPRKAAPAAPAAAPRPAGSGKPAATNAGKPSAPEAAASDKELSIGDKNLINDSTIIGKQEKYEASNITIQNNITEDHSHMTIVCAVSGKRVYLDRSVVCPECGRQVALEYYVEASKRCEICEQQARETFRANALRITAGKALDASCKRELDDEARRLRLGADTQASILRSLRQHSANDDTTLSPVLEAELEAAVKSLIEASGREEAGQALQAIAVLHESSSNPAVGFWYFLARAVFEPEDSVRCYEEEVTDDYWQRYWGYLAYLGTGSPKGGAAVDRIRAAFGARIDDIRLAETSYYLARGFESSAVSMTERAAELASQIRREALSTTLLPIYDTLRRVLDEGVRLDASYTQSERFVLLEIFRAGKYIDRLHEERLREERQEREERERIERETRERQERLARERQAAEEEQQRKQAALAAEREARLAREKARLHGKPEPAAPEKAFAGYTTTIPAKKSSPMKRVLIIIGVLLLIIIALFLIPAPESWQ